MRIKFLIAVAAWSVACATPAGTITGIVRAQGKEGAGTEDGGGNYDSHALKHAVKLDYAALTDFVVFIEGPVAGGTNVAAKTERVETARSKVTQDKAQFDPHVLPIQAGTTVEWPNNDRIYHNVFSFSDAKQFDLGLYKSGDSRSVTFDKPGRVDVFCSIHSTMNCIVLVLENPYFAKADGKGRYTIPNVPPGRYKLKSWHERLPMQDKEIIVPEQGDVRVDFTMGITGLPKI